jgi:tRNA-Thr(GGU) m(6)t(6)A37 methyltransferase TsaA
MWVGELMPGQPPDPFGLHPVGHVESSLVDPAKAPMQGFEGAPEAWLVFDPEFRDALRDIRIGDELLVLTWLHRARRDVLSVRPRDDETQPMRGVFSTRSQDRPNPIGVHRVEVVGSDGNRVRVDALEAIDGTPIIDVKPVIASAER